MKITIKREVLYNILCNKEDENINVLAPRERKFNFYHSGAVG